MGMTHIFRKRRGSLSNYNLILRGESKAHECLKCISGTLESRSSLKARRPGGCSPSAAEWSPRAASTHLRTEELNMPVLSDRGSGTGPYHRGDELPVMDGNIPSAGCAA